MTDREPRVLKHKNIQPNLKKTVIELRVIFAIVGEWGMLTSQPRSLILIRLNELSTAVTTALNSVIVTGQNPFHFTNTNIPLYLIVQV